MAPFEAGAVALAAGAFVLGGVVKGTLGIGLPLVAVPLLALSMPATRAIGLMVIPVVASNTWQVWDSGISVEGVRRFLPLIAALLVTTLVTVPMTLKLSDAGLRGVLALVVLLAVVLTALPLKLQVTPAREAWCSLGVGLLSGVMGGLSSLTGPVIVSYLVSLRLQREVFVGSISVIYLAGALPLYASMAAHDRIGVADVGLSALALVPMACGLLVGKRLRGRLDETWFRRLLLLFLVCVAISLLR